MLKSDKELIINTLNGDNTAFEQLVFRYDSKVLNIALRFAGNIDEANDLYQEIFIRVYKGLGNFEYRSEFSTWLFRIATNVCLTYSSMNKRQQKVSVNADDENEEQSYFSQLVEKEKLPDRISENNELNDVIHSAVNELSNKQRMTFILKHYEGYKIREIAEMLQCNDGTVKKYLFDATRNLRKSLSYLKR